MVESSNGVSAEVSAGASAFVVLVLVWLVVAGGVTVVVTLVTTTVVGSVVAGSLTVVFTGSLMMPSHSLPVSTSSLGVSSVVGTSEASSAKTGEVAKVTAEEPIRMRLKNNLTNFFIIFYYTILCYKRQEVV